MHSLCNQAAFVCLIGEESLRKCACVFCSNVSIMYQGLNHWTLIAYCVLARFITLGTFKTSYVHLR